METVRKIVLFFVIGMTIIVSSKAAAATTQRERLIRALIAVESRGDDYAIGDHHMNEKAYGPLQIRKLCVDDVNRRYRMNIEPQRLYGDRHLSVWVCQKYLEMYATPKRLGREPTLEDLARIWNGGPNGFRRSSTHNYWLKVKRELR